MGTLYPEMSVHEKGVDFYIDLLHKGQLDENVPLTNLEKTVSYLDTIFPLHLADLPLDCPTYMADHVKLLLAALDHISMEVARARELLDKAGEGSAVGLLLKALDTQAREVESHVKTMKRRLPQDGSQGPISYSSSTGASLAAAAASLGLVVKVLSSVGRAVLQLAVSSPEAGVPAPKMQEALHTAVDTVTDLGDQGIALLTSSLASALGKVAIIATAVQNGEFDFDGTREASPPANPVLLRAEEVKAEIRDATQLKYKLEAKDVDMKDLKKLLKVKQEELSEMQIRKDLLEKKLSDSSKDSELMVEKLQRKLDDAHNLLHRKEKEFEETMDHLQADIDCLESEKGELKDRMKMMSKKALIEGLTKSSLASSPGPSLGPSLPSPVRDSPLLVQQLQEMRQAVEVLQVSNARLQASDLRDRISRLEPLRLPLATVAGGEKGDRGREEKTDRSKEAGGGEQLGQLMKRCNTARAELYTLLSRYTVH